jgi:hypothetical protein
MKILFIKKEDIPSLGNILNLTPQYRFRIIVNIYTYLFIYTFISQIPNNLATVLIIWAALKKNYISLNLRKTGRVVSIPAVRDPQPPREKIKKKNRE